MFDRKLLYTLTAIGAVVVVTVTLDAIPERGEISPVPAPVAEYGEAANAELPFLPYTRVTPEPDPVPVYIIREHEGHIAVFAHGATIPQIIFDTQVKFLPDFDRAQLGEGIEVWSYDELTALIEDYIS